MFPGEGEKTDDEYILEVTDQPVQVTKKED